MVHSNRTKNREFYDDSSIGYAVVDLTAPVVNFRHFRFNNYNITIQHNFPLVNGTLFRRQRNDGIQLNFNPSLTKVALVEKLVVRTIH